MLIVLLSAPVFILIVVFAVKYRRGRPANRKHPVNSRVGLEISWAVIPFVLILFFYVWATWLFFDLHHPPADALDIDVVAKQWMWKFQHPGGQREINELHVPAGEPVKLAMASQDVIHSLFIPALRIKQDLVPGRYTTLWFNADAPGDYWLTCAEFCGTDHSVMGGALHRHDARRLCAMAAAHPASTGRSPAQARRCSAPTAAAAATGPQPRPCTRRRSKVSTAASAARRTAAP